MKLIKKIWIALILCLVFIPSINAQEEKPMSILLLGVDSGGLGRTEIGRSDVMMVLTANPTTQEVTLTSIPRDTYVNIDGYGMDKINHAYAYGGAELSKKTVDEFLEIELDNFITVNMGGLAEIVDALGGVEVTAPTTFEMSGYTFEEGVTQTLNGAQALAYARERYTSGGDYARQERQRQIINASIKKLSQFNSVLQLREVLQAINDNVQTDLDFVSLMTIFTKYKDQFTEVESYQLTGYGEMIDGVYYDIPDESVLSDIKEKIKTTLESRKTF